MNGDPVFSAAEHQALELIESRFEHEDRRLAELLAHGFEHSGWVLRLQRWLALSRWLVALVGAAASLPLAGLMVAGPEFAGVVGVLALVGVVVLAAAAWAGRHAYRALVALATQTAS